MYILQEERQCSPSNIATLGLDVLAPLCTQNVGACRWTSGRASLARFEKVLKAEDQKMLAFVPLEPLAWRLLS